MMKKLMISTLIILMIFLSSCGGYMSSYPLKGDLDYYYEEGYRLSDFETTEDLVYSVEFVKKFEALDFAFYYYSAPISFIYPLGEYDLCIISITYPEENYELAKQDLFDNTAYISLEKPNYMHNGYDFYSEAWRSEFDRYTDRVFHAFNDTQKTVVLMGMNISGKSDINLDVPEEEWPEFLRTYFGEYYDFDA